MEFNDRRRANVNKKALKAANGLSLASKKYKPDTAGRQAVRKAAVSGADRPDSNKQRYNKAAISVDRSGSANINDPWTSPGSNIRRK